MGDTSLNVFACRLGKSPVSRQILIIAEFARQMFDNSSYTKFQETTSDGSRVVPYGQTDMAQLISFRNCAKAPKIPHPFPRTCAKNQML